MVGVAFVSKECFARLQGGKMLIADSLKILLAKLAMTGASLATKTALLLAELSPVQPSVPKAVPLKTQSSKRAMSGASWAKKGELLLAKLQRLPFG